LSYRSKTLLKKGRGGDRDKNNERKKGYGQLNVYEK